MLVESEDMAAAQGVIRQEIAAIVAHAMSRQSGSMANWSLKTVRLPERGLVKFFVDHKLTSKSSPLLIGQ
jgi:hypothetical protein